MRVRVGPYKPGSGAAGGRRRHGGGVEPRTRREVQAREARQQQKEATARYGKLVGALVVSLCPHAHKLAVCCDEPFDKVDVLVPHSFGAVLSSHGNRLNVTGTGMAVRNADLSRRTDCVSLA